MRVLALLFTMLLVFNLGCSKNPDRTVVSAEHPAMTAANQVLVAIHASDAAALRPLLNATNQRKMSDADWVGLFREAKGSIGDVRQVSELRRHFREGYVVAKIRVIGHEVFVVVMSLEDGQYLFEDISSPGISAYEALEIIAP